MERPKPPMDNTPVGNEPSGGMKMPSGGIILYVIVAVIAIIAAFGVNYMFGVSKSGMDTQTKATSAALAAMQSDLKASKDSINAAIAGINPAVTKQVSDGLKSLNDQITKLQSSVDNASNSSQSANNQVANLGKTVADWQSQLATIKTDVATLKSSTADADLKTSLNAVSDRILSLETKVTSLNTQVTVLMNPPTTTTTTVANGTNGTSSTLNGVTATLTGVNNWLAGTSTSSMQLTSTAPSGTFGVSINNTKTTSVNNFQLGIVLQILDYTSSSGATTTLAVIPVGSTLTDSTITNSWAFTPITGYTHIIAFQNGIGVGSLGIGQWNIPSGTSNYTMTFTLVIPTTGLVSGHTYYVTPIKVVIIGMQ